MMHPEYISLRLSHEQPFLPYDSLCQMLWKRAFLHNLLFLLKEFQAPPLPLYNALLNQSVPALLPLMGHPHLVHKKNREYFHPHPSKQTLSSYCPSSASSSAFAAICSSRTERRSRVAAIFRRCSLAPSLARPSSRP